MEIRLTREEEFFETENLTREAFWNLYRPGCDEHLMLNNSRKCDEYIRELDCVLVEEDRIIAHIMYCIAELIADDGQITPVIMFGPVSVEPRLQKQGYGEKIINYTLDKAKSLGYGAVLITGSPEYYNRFGFSSCANYKIYLEGNSREVEAPYFMVKVLRDNYLPDVPSMLKMPHCYTTDPKELEEFEKLFPPKVKEKRPGQLFD